MPQLHETLNYVEFASHDLLATKAFFADVFAWQFTDYGDGYTSFANQGLDGGFYASDTVATAKDGGVLLVFYSENLRETYQKVVAHGGVMTQEVFAFPGGFRFHFIEPGGNELAVWSEQH